MTEPCRGRLCIELAQLEGNVHTYSGWNYESGMKGFVWDDGDGIIDEQHTAAGIPREKLQREVSAIRSALATEIAAKVRELKNAMQAGKATKEIRAFDRCGGKGKIYAGVEKFGTIEARDYGQDGTYEYFSFYNANGVRIFVDTVSEVEIIMFPSCIDMAKSSESIRRYLGIVNDELGLYCAPRID